MSRSTQKARREYFKALHGGRIARGECCICASPRGADGTNRLCRGCADYTNEQRQRCRRPAQLARARRERREAGLCVLGRRQHAAKPGRAMCAAHARHRNEVDRERTARMTST